MPRPPEKAEAVATILTRRIKTGVYEEDTWLPSSRRLEQDEEIDAERGTIDRAKHILQKRGYVRITKGGAKVRRPIRQEEADVGRPVGRWRGFGAAVKRAGGEPYVDVRSVREVGVPGEAAYWLEVEAGSTVVERHRVHGAIDGGRRIPISVATTWILLAVAERIPAVSEVDTGPGGITERLADAGYELRYEDVVVAREASAGEAELLDIKEGSPVVEVWRRSYDQDGRIVKVSCRVVNSREQELSYKYPR